MAADGSKRGVNIPVEVTGAEQAQAELRDTKAAVEGVGTGGAKAARGAKELGDAAAKTNPKLDEAKDKGKKAADSIFDFDNKAERAAKTLLGLFSSQLASALDLILDLGQGLLRLNPLLLAISAGAAVFGLIASAMRSASEQAERLTKELQRQLEVQQRQSTEGQKLRRQIADDLAAVGVFDNASVTTAAKQTVELNRIGVTGDLARGAATAQAVAEAAGVPFQAFDFVAGTLAQGKTSVDLGRTNAEALSVIAKTLAIGAGEDAKKAAKEYISSTFGDAIGEYIAQSGSGIENDVTSALSAVVKQQGATRGLTPEQQRQVFRLAAASLGVSGEDRAQVQAAEGLEPKLIVPTPPIIGRNPLETPQYKQNIDEMARVGPVLGAAAEAVDLIGRVAPTVDATGLVSPRASATRSQPVVIQNITNIGTVLQSSDRLGDYTFNPALDRESFRR